MSSQHRLSVLSSRRANAHQDATQRGSNSFTQQQQQQQHQHLQQQQQDANNRNSYEFRLAQYNEQYSMEMAAFELQKQQYEEQQSYLLHLLHTDPTQYHAVMQDQLRIEQKARDQLEAHVSELAQAGRPSLSLPSPPVPLSVAAPPANAAPIAPSSSSSAGPERSRFSHMLQAPAQGSETGSAVLNRKLALKREQVHTLSTRVAVAMHKVAEQPQGGTLK